ncbi:MAG: response regulator [Armatimonadetes bacterium]|nr:response regulator [Armatimonadota bacterium]
MMPVDEETRDHYEKLGREIRTPLTAIIGSTEMLLNGTLSGEQRQMVELVQSSAAKLWKMVDELDGGREARDLSPTPQPPPSPTLHVVDENAMAAGPLDVLVVEDDADNQAIVVRILEWAGHRTHVADSGREALALMERRNVDVVLMDLNLPGFNGMETTAAIRAREGQRGHRVPIIALTAHAAHNYREQAIQAGMDGYLTKPLQARSLLEEIQRLARQAPVIARAPALALQVIDLQAALSNVSGDQRLLGRLARRLLDRLPSTVEALKQAVESADARGVEKTSQGLLGGVAIFAVRPVSEIVKALGGLVRWRHVDAASAMMGVLKIELERLSADLQAIVASPDLGDE